MANLILILLLSAVISYLIGSLNSSIIAVRVLKGVDIRQYGSKNAGLTNTLRCFGKLPAACTLIGDLSKGVIAVLISRLLLHLIAPDIEFTSFIGYFSGIFSIAGHIFPVYYGFKGGKGVLVSSSVLIVVDPMTFCIIIPFFLLLVLTTRYVSVSSITAAIVYPILTFFIQYFVKGWPLENVLIDCGLIVITSAILIYMHKANIERLKNGTENRFSLKKKSSD